MCECCDIIKVLFKEANTNPHIYYQSIINFLEAMEKSEKAELFAGDTLLKDAVNILYEEKHYTVCHYVRCKKCGLIYFVGACIRGKPIFKEVKDIEKENIDNLIWGCIGFYYNI